jgi:hypothetical protein
MASRSAQLVTIDPLADLRPSLNLNSTVSGLSEPSHAMAPEPSSSCHPTPSSSIDTSCHLGNDANDPGPIADGGSSVAETGNGTSIMRPNKTSTTARYVNHTRAACIIFHQYTRICVR